MKNRTLYHAILSISSGVLLSAGWLGGGMFILMAFVPLLIISSALSASKGDFWRMFGWVALAFGVWSASTTWWIWYAAPVGAILSVVITIGLFGGMFMLFHWVSKRSTKTLSYTLLVAGWIACEYLYTVGEVSFPWLILGNGFANSTWLVQWYDTTGVFGGTLWVWLVNLTFYHSMISKRKLAWLAGTVALVIPMTISIVKYYTYKEVVNPLKITVVQPNIEPYFEKFIMSQQVQTNILLGLAAEAPPDVDYIVMPETAIDNAIWESSIAQNNSVEQIRTLGRESYPGAQFIVGAMTYKRYGEGEKISRTARTNSNIDYWYDIYNSAFTVDTTSATQIHHKSTLVIGVEKMPDYWFIKHLEFLIVDLGGTTGYLGIDDERMVLTHPNGAKSAAPICYESVYGAHFSGFARNGAQVLFIITNDGWWHDTPGYRQHFSFARLRAIETRRSIARSANTGISGFIDQRGKVLSTLEWEQRGTLTNTLNANDHLTFYTRYGDYIARLSYFTFGLCVLYFIVYRLRKRNEEGSIARKKPRRKSAI